MNRKSAADEALALYDFEHPIKEGSDWKQYMDTWFKTIIVDSAAMTFVVNFVRGTAEVSEAFVS